MRKIEPEFITGMGYIGASPGVLYRMGGAGEQTVVTGNPALLEGVKGNRFTSLTLHGISTQVSTTGANILKDTYLSLCKGGVDLFTTNGLFTANSNYEKNVEFNLLFTEGSIFADSIKDEETYYIVFRPIGFTPAYRFQLSLKNGAHETMTTSAGAIVASVSGAVLKKTARIQLYFFNVSGAIPIVSGSKFQMIFSRKSDCIYEPYTGGKPSPSPEYPRPIVSSGDDGSIGLDITGANLINASSIKSEEKLGVKLTNNGDGSFTFKGTTAESYFVTTYNYLTNLVPGEYAFALDGAKNVQACIRYTKNGVNRSWMADSKLSFDGSETNIFFYMQVKPNTTVNETVFPMLNVGSVFLDSEEYKEQFVSIPTPGGLPGIPVSSGGNYTDEKGQQWVCDEVDLANGEMVQRIGKTVVDGEKVKFVSSGSIYWNLPYGTSPGTINGATFISRYFARNTFSGNNKYEFVWTTSGIMKSYFDTPEELNAFCVQKNSEGNPLTIYYRIETPIRTPLPPETIAAYKALRTYSPTTTVINDADAGMSVGYKRRK